MVEQFGIAPMSAAERPVSIVIVDPDQDASRDVARLLRQSGYTSVELQTGADCLKAPGLTLAGLLLIASFLPDMRGPDLVRALRRRGCNAPFIMLIGTTSIRIIVEAMRLGAIDVIEHPPPFDHLLAVVRTVLPPAAIATGAAIGNGAGHEAPMLHPRSTAERWALLAMRGCRADGDLRTLDDWAACAGVSYTSLRETCMLVSIRPHDARDLVRMLRAVITALRCDCPPSVLLDVSDRRTLNQLLDRAGLGNGAGAARVSVDQFFASQRFVPQHNEGLRILRRQFGAEQR